MYDFQNPSGETLSLGQREILVRLAREHGFYMQKYCGCIFSEEDRYCKAIARDKKNTMVHFDD